MDSQQYKVHINILLTLNKIFYIRHFPSLKVNQMLVHTFEINTKSIKNNRDKSMKNRRKLFTAKQYSADQLVGNAVRVLFIKIQRFFMR